MTRTFQAIVENGSLRPIEAVDLPEHQRVRVTVEAITVDRLDRPDDGRAAARRHLVEFLRNSPLRIEGPLPTRDELYDDRV